MLFHAISLFMRLKGNRVKPRAYQAATTNGYRHESRKHPISSGVLTHFPDAKMKLLSSHAHRMLLDPPASGVMATCRHLGR
jgi:cytochrome c553